MPSDADLQAMSVMATAAVQAVTRELENLNKKGREVTGASGGLTSVNTSLQAMSRNLVFGATSVAAGFVAVAKAMEGVATASVQLQAFANNTGFAASQVNEMQQGMRRMGMSMQEAQSVIATLGGKLQNLGAFKEASELYQTLATAPGGAAFANRIKELVQSGNQMGAVSEILRTFNNQTRQSQIALSQYFGVSIDVLQNLSARMQRNVKQWLIDPKEAQRYLDMWVDFETHFGNIWTNIGNHGIEALNKLSESAKESGITAKSIADAVNSGVDAALKTIQQDIRDVQKIIEVYQSLKGWFGQTMGNTYRRPYPAAEDPMGADYVGKYPAADDPMGKDYRVGMKSGPSDLIVRTARNSDEQTQLLGEIRDILQRFETGGEGGAASERGRAGLAARLGMRAPRESSTGGPEGQGSVGGGNVDMKGGEKSSTGLYYPGTSQKLAGVVGSDSASRGRGGHQGDDYMMPHGSPLYATKDGTVEAYGTDNFGQKTMRIRHPDGSSTSYLHMSERSLPIGASVKGGQVIGASGTANRVPHLHIEMRDPKGRLQEPAVELGLRKRPVQREDAQPQGTVKGSWFNDRTTASGISAATASGIATPGREGLGQMFKVTDENGKVHYLPKIDVGPAKWTGRGVDFSTAAARQLGFDPTDRHFKVEPDDRDRIDKRAVAGSDVFGKLNAKIEFLNVPNGVKTGAEAEGDVFQKLQINRTKQGGIYNQESQGYD